jgi:hypothetical protein
MVIKDIHTIPHLPFIVCWKIIGVAGGWKIVVFGGVFQRY